jgi:hypothetical protein
MEEFDEEGNPEYKEGSNGRKEEKGSDMSTAG